MTLPLYPLRQAASWMLGQPWRLRSLLTSASAKQEAGEYLSAHQDHLFFILGTGRSGTQLIADLMNASGQTLALQDPDFRADIATMNEFRKNLGRAVRFWRDFRNVEICRWWKAGGDTMARLVYCLR